MSKDAILNITPENGWRFTAFSIVPNAEGRSFHSPLHTDTVYLGSRAVEAGVREAAHSISDADRFVEVVPFPSEILRGTHSDILNRSRELIQKQVNKAEADGRGLIISFSAWGGQQSFDAMSLIEYTRKISEGRAVCIVGGPGFSAHATEIEAAFFAAGADIINLGGGKEITEWIGRLTKKNQFGRDANGRLMASVPDNAPFFSSSPKETYIPTGGDLPVPAYFNPMAYMVDVSLGGSGCSNRCDFCAVEASLVCPAAPEPEDLPEQVNAILKNENTEAKRELMNDAMSKPKGLVDALKKKLRLQNDWDEMMSLVTLNVVNPNPTQGHGYERLDNFFSKIDMKEPLCWSYFIDATSLRTTEGADQHRLYLQNKLKENKKLVIDIGIALDALQAENDGDFLGRRIGKRLVTPEEYKAIWNNYHHLIDEFSGEGFGHRIFVTLHQIIHPGMTAEVYQQKSGLWRETNPEIVHHCKEFTLTPYEGTALSKKYKGHYAPQHFMDKDWELGYAMQSMGLSCWGNQFENGDLLDCIAFMQNNGFLMKSAIPNILLHAIVDGWDEGKVKPDFYKDIIKERFVKKFTNDAQKILDTKPRIIGVMNYFMNSLDDMDNKDSRIVAWDREFDSYFNRIIGRDHYNAVDLAQGINASVHWILRRERYLAEVNADYANNPNCQKLIIAAEEIRGRLLSKRYADKFDLRPLRSMPTNKKGIAHIPN